MLLEAIAQADRGGGLPKSHRRSWEKLASTSQITGDARFQAHYRVTDDALVVLAFWQCQSRQKVQKLSRLRVSPIAHSRHGQHRPGAPPPGLIAFYWHFVRQTKGWYAAMFATSLAVALIDTVIPVFIGKLVSLMEAADRHAALASSRRCCSAWWC